MLRLFNTLTREKETLTPIHKEWVGLYTCGPTVYNFAHIGNLRTYIFEDILQRTLEYDHYAVRRVMNITDVGHLTGDSDAGEDKLDKEARTEKKSVEEIAQFYTKAFLDDLEKLNIKRPDIIAPATKFINDQIALIETLFERGFAYDTPTAVYFNVSKDKTYGKLSGQSLAEKITGARDEVIVDKGKRNAADFALWFKLTGKFKKHLLHWPSPWGEGFPGWHIECSAISRHFLGQPFDIHTGGVDHIGTHHENEIAQSEAAYGVPLAHVWMHGEFLLMNAEKMAKSEKNFFTLKDIEERGINPLAFRYLVLGTHYRSKMNFTWESLEAAQNGLWKFYAAHYQLLDAARGVGDLATVKLSRDGQEILRNFKDALNDDLNTPRSLAILHEAMGSDILAAEKAHLIGEFDEILGILMGSRPVIPKKVQELLTKREQSRDNKQFEQADRLRKEINDLGYEVEDTPQGPFLWPQQKNHN
ncbi:MAG: cysteine--tRNA ligase [Minisyncoccia bacterium]|jgi:cysteinyl-tRNA synthetase